MLDGNKNAEEIQLVEQRKIQYDCKTYEPTPIADSRWQRSTGAIMTSWKELAIDTRRV